MATSGEVVTYGEYEARTNRLAHLLRDQGLQRLDHYSIFMENNARYLEMCGAGERSGPLLHVHQLAPDRRGAGLHRQQQRVPGVHHLAGEARRGPATSSPMCPAVERWLVVDGPPTTPRSRTTWRPSSGYPDTPIADERQRRGDALLVGHDRPAEGHRRASSPTCRPPTRWPLMQFLIDQWRYREGQIYLSPAPLYHSAPQGAVGLTIRSRRDGDHHGALRPRAVPPARRALPGDAQPARADDVQPDAQAARRGPLALRPVLAGDRRPRRRAVPDPGQGADDRVVGPGDHRVLRGDRGASATRRATPRSGSPTRARSGGASSACCTSSTTSSTRSRPARRARSGSRRRPGSTTGTTRRRRRRRRRPDGTDAHHRRRRLRRRRGVAVPDRPQVVHDHLRRCQHLPPGDREPADHPPQGGRRRRVRRAQPRPRRGGQGRRPADARRRAARPSWSGS